MRIKDFKESDIEFVMDAKKEIAKKDFTGEKPDENFFRDYIAKDAKTPVAEQGGKPVDCISYSARNSMVGKAGKIKSLFVDKNWRKKV